VMTRYAERGPPAENLHGDPGASGSLQDRGVLACSVVDDAQAAARAQDSHGLRWCGTFSAESMV